MALAVVQPPAAGVWRVGRARDPIEFPEPPAGEELEYKSTGNRFDSPTEDFRTCYFATEPAACFGETLSRFRPNPALADAANEEGYMGIGQVPADWRYQRIIVQTKFAPTFARPNLCFLDVESLETREQLRRDLAESSRSTAIRIWMFRPSAVVIDGSRAGSANGLMSSVGTRARRSPASDTCRD